MMDDVLTATQPVVTRYVRITRHRQGRVVDSLLVRRKVRKSFNGRGQLVSVRNVITPVTPHEYDQVRGPRALFLFLVFLVVVVVEKSTR
eukprot:2848612-Rhodomonas_salina.2